MLRIAIQPLVAMLSAGGAEATVHVARAVTSLSGAEPNRDALRDAGALPEGWVAERRPSIGGEGWRMGDRRAAEDGGAAAP